MFRYHSSKNTGSKSWMLQRITGLALVILMIGHYILMHYHPESGHTYEAVLKRMSFSWYRIIDLTFLILGFYHGLNGLWNIFRDYELKPWAKISVASVLVILWVIFVSWGFAIIFSIPYAPVISIR